MHGGERLELYRRKKMKDDISVKKNHICELVYFGIGNASIKRTNTFSPSDAYEHFPSSPSILSISYLIYERV